MTRYAKRKLKYSLSENFNLFPNVEWDRFVTLTEAQAEWGLRYRIYRLWSSLFRNLIQFLFSVVYCDIKSLFLLKYIQSFFSKVGTEIFFIGLKSTNRIVTKKQYTLYVGGYSAENFFEARFNFNEIMSLELFNQGIGLQVCTCLVTFVMVLHFFLYLPASMDTRPWLNIYILISNKSKQNVIAYL